MKPSLRSTSAIESFIFDAGMFTYSCFAVTALRIRVSMSAIGSVMFKACVSSFSRAHPLQVLSGRTAICDPALPARLLHSGQLSLKRHPPEADPAQREIADVGARPPAHFAAVLCAHAVLRLTVRPDDLGRFRHRLRPLLRKRHTHHLQQAAALFVVARR